MVLRETYNLVVCSARVVGPRRLLHDLPGNRLKVHEVVASGKRGHPLHALQTTGLLRVNHLLFLLNSTHINLAEVLGLVKILVKGVWGVDGFELLGRVLAGILEDDLLAARVFYNGRVRRF